MLLKNIYKKARRNPLLNRVFRNLVRTFAYGIPGKVQSSAMPYVPVSGEFGVKLATGTQFRFYAEADDNIANVLYYDPAGYEEYNELLLFSMLAKRSRTILDVGANTGVFTVIAGTSNKKATICAFEPYSVNAARLKKNIELNHIQNATIITSAVGDFTGEISFTVPEDNRICDVLSANDEFTRKFYRDQVSYKTIKVNQVTIDSLQPANVDLMKIDVESYEIPVFKGAVNTLRKYKPVILCEIFVEEKRDEFYTDFLRDLGYHIYIHLPSGIVLTDKLTANADSRNFIFSTAKTSRTYTSFREHERMCDELFSR